MRRCVKLVPEGLPVCSALRAPDRFDLAGMPSTFVVKLDSNGGHKPATYSPPRPVRLRYTPKRTARSLRVKPRRSAIFRPSP
jgi:hypothetical protein